MIYNKVLTSKDARSYADDLVDTIEVLEDEIKELTQQLEDEKGVAVENIQVAEQNGFDKGYVIGWKEAEKKYNPKFVFR